MVTGIVHSYRVGGTTHLCVAFRGQAQLLPSESVSFLTQEDMIYAIGVVAGHLGWKLPLDFPYQKVWKDVKSGIGRDFHPSMFYKVIPIKDGGDVLVYRSNTNSALG